MASAPERFFIPPSPDELWTQVVLPYVEGKLRWISSSFPAEVLPPDFQNSYLVIAHKNFGEKVKKKKDFKKWADKIKDWKGWAHDLIPYQKINPTYLESEWNRLCKKNPEGSGFSGQAPKTVKKLRHLKPNDVSNEEFFEIVLDETCANFMKRYFSSFQEPMEAWLYELAKTSATDYVNRWVPGLRYANADDRPKGFQSIDEPRKGPEGESREPLKQTLSGSQPFGADNALILAESISKIHARDPQGIRSNRVIEYRNKWGYTQREIAKTMKCRTKEVEQILDDDLKRWYIIGVEEFGMRPKGPKS